MHSRFGVLICFACLAVSHLDHSALAAESSPDNPFTKFVGSYKTTPIDCSVNAMPIGGCDITEVHLSLQPNGTLQITETRPGDTQTYPIYEASDDQDGGSLRAKITGSAERAAWEYARTFPGGSQSATMKIFLYDGGHVLYHSYHRDWDRDGVDFVMKQTYMTEKF
ncbi:MAG: hypothetical protein A2X94_12470 [Bdellovibrionales bacterium GWB1_55_8]|nr:MAG: hypothetical protein A2X94_12470 [Bdellovibrionales bacterium GWB1_55_8]